MSDQEIQDLLLKYRQGKCSPDDIIRIHMWYESLNKDFILSMDEEEKLFLEEKLLSKIDLSDDDQPARIYTQEPQLKDSWWNYPWLRYGAAASVLLVLGLLFVLNKNQQTPILKSETLIVHSKQGHLKSSFNDSKSNQRVRLDDNSVVTLSPGSRISYPAVFSKNKREVQLEGDAFFEISKNPDQPFFVYSGKLVTKVLGTSFWVKTNIQCLTTDVEVITGKVSVFENIFLNTGKKSGHNSEGVVLTPNQRVSYYEQSGHLLTGIVEAPVSIPENEDAFNLVFNNETLGDITSVLQKKYGIEIVFANDLLEKCTFTGDISEIPLYDKLDLICKANTAFYEIKGTRILITGNGCD